MYDHVRDNVENRQAKQKVRYDSRIQGKPFSVGDQVWLHNSAVPRGKSRKLHRPWTGPFRVVTKLSDSVYRLQHMQFRRRRPVVHFNRLKPCSQGTRFPSPCTHTPQRKQASPCPPVGARLQLLDDDSALPSDAFAGDPLPPNSQLPGQPLAPVSDTSSSPPASPLIQRHLPRNSSPSPTSTSPPATPPTTPPSVSESPQPPPRRYPQRQRVAPSRLYGTVKF